MLCGAILHNTQTCSYSPLTPWQLPQIYTTPVTCCAHWKYHCASKGHALVCSPISQSRTCQNINSSQYTGSHSPPTSSPQKGIAWPQLSPSLSCSPHPLRNLNCHTKSQAFSFPFMPFQASISTPVEGPAFPSQCMGAAICSSYPNDSIKSPSFLLRKGTSRTSATQLIPPPPFVIQNPALYLQHSLQELVTKATLHIAKTTFDLPSFCRQAQGRRMILFPKTIKMKESRGRSSLFLSGKWLSWRFSSKSSRGEVSAWDSLRDE